jgi:hypothetical protein
MQTRGRKHSEILQELLASWKNADEKKKYTLDRWAASFNFKLHQQFKCLRTN